MTSRLRRARRSTMDAMLVAEVHALRRRTRRRRFAPAASVRLLDEAGEPVGAGSPDLLGWSTADDVADRTALDHGFRVDLLVGGIQQLLADGVPVAVDGVDAVVVRPGLPEPTDDDLAWWRALRAAAGVANLRAATVYAVTRQGWIDVNAPTPVLVARRRAGPGNTSR